MLKRDYGSIALNGRARYAGGRNVFRIILAIKPQAVRMLTIDVEREDDGRWLAEIVDLPGVLAYGQTRQEAIERAQALSLRVLADRLEHGESVPQMDSVFAVAP